MGVDEVFRDGAGFTEGEGGGGEANVEVEGFEGGG